MKNTIEPRAEEVLQVYDSGVTSATNLASMFGSAPSAMRQFLIRHGRSTQRTFAHCVATLTPTEAAYLAGLIDGEGCVFARRTLSRKCWGVQAGLAIAMTSGEVLRQMRDMTGVGTLMLSPSNKSKGERWKDCWRWDVGAQACAELLDKLLPYLRLKRRQAELVIELADIKRQSSPGHQHNKERQFAIVDEMQALNKRGQG